MRARNRCAGAVDAAGCQLTGPYLRLLRVVARADVAGEVAGDVGYHWGRLDGDRSLDTARTTPWAAPGAPRPGAASVGAGASRLAGPGRGRAAGKTTARYSTTERRNEGNHLRKFCKRLPGSLLGLRGVTTSGVAAQIKIQGIQRPPQGSLDHVCVRRWPLEVLTPRTIQHCIFVEPVFRGQTSTGIGPSEEGKKTSRADTLT